MKVEGIFFDLYGTLLVYGDMKSAWSDWLSALFENLKSYGLQKPKNTVATYCEGLLEKKIPKNTDKSLTLFERRIQGLTRDLGLDLGHKEIRETALSCIDAWQKYVSLDPEAPSVLETLKPKKSLALITNYDHPPFIYSLLSKLQLDIYFEVIVISGEIGVRKPDPLTFSPALKQTRLHPSKVIYLGDTAEDVQAAQAAGLCPILIRRKQNENNLAFDFTLNSNKKHNNEELMVNASNLKIISSLSELIEL